MWGRYAISPRTEFGREIASIEKGCSNAFMAIIIVLDIMVMYADVPRLVLGMFGGI